MGSQVPRVITPLTSSQAAPLLVDALSSALGKRPASNVALFSLALMWLETGAGQGMVCHSPGNVMARGIRAGSEYSVWSGDYWRPEWWDAAWSNQKMRDGEWPSAFRAYATFADGFSDFAKAIASRPALLSAMGRGDARAVAVALRDTKYSPDYGPQHAASLSKLVAQFKSEGLFFSLSAGASGVAVVVAGAIVLLGALFVFRRSN